MDIEHKKILRALTLEMRHLLEGEWRQDTWVAGDLEQRLRSLGVRPDGSVVPVDELPHLAPHDIQARTVIDAWLTLRLQSGATGQDAVAELVRETAWSWATRLIALRCMEARGLIDDEVILTKPAYAGRSMLHNRLVRKDPALERREDGGLFDALAQAFDDLVQYLPRAFDPKAPGIALRPSVAAMTWCIGLLSGTQRPRGQEAATDEVFKAADALGWAYQYWNTEEKQRVFDRAAGKGPDRKRHKIERADIVPATQLYTEPYMVQFLVQNGLGGLWVSMHPNTRLTSGWAYFVRDVERPQVPARPVRELSFFDPACGSGHFLLEAFDLFFEMYREEDPHRDATSIAADILGLNLYGLDIDERAVHIAEVALWMKAAERAQAEDRDAPFARAYLAAANVRLPKGADHLDRFLERYPQDKPLRVALEVVFEGLEHADELGSLLLLDEPVEAALRAIQAAEEAKPRAAAAHKQLLLLGVEAQGALPLEAKSWESWRTDVLMRLRDHFEQEAASADPVQAYFGRSVEQAFDVFDLLSRRYDVVAANPPYMGSKNMGPVLRKHVEKHFTAGKRDLYAAFILRCMSLTRPSGRVAMVTQQSWMFMTSFAALRFEPHPDGDSGLLAWGHLSALAQLGRYAFSEIGNAVVSPVLFVCARENPSQTAPVWGCRLTVPRPSNEQARLLQSACAGSLPEVVSRVEQYRLKALPGAPFCYWLRPRFLALFGKKTVGDVGGVRQGMATADDRRFLRYAWEIFGSERWFPFYKGGGYRKWDGLANITVDWQFDGARVRQTPGPRVQNESFFFRTDWTYSLMAQGRMAVRRQFPPSVFGHMGPALLLERRCDVVSLSSRTFSYLLRAISPSLKFEVDSVKKGPIPEIAPSIDPEALIAIKARLTATDPTERAFAAVADLPTTLAWCSELHTLEGQAERAVMAAYGLDADDIAAVLADTGTPAGWLSDELDDAARARVRTLFEAGPGGSLDEDAAEDLVSDDEADDDSEAPTELGTGRPIHPETFLEELSEKAGVSPRAAWSAIQEGLAAGWRCVPEERRIAADRVSVLVLRLLGHRWPLQLEAGEPLPDWADTDGIVPLTSIPHEKPLIERLRERLEADGLSEAELATALGAPLDQWLHINFASHHTTQFKRRPVVWQVQSSSFTTRRPPAFAALLYCQKVSAEMLASVRTQYVGPLLQRRRQEVRTLENAAQRDQAQEQQLKDLGLAVAELENFANALIEIERDGFATPELQNIATQDAVQSLIQPLLGRWQAELRTGPLSSWQVTARTIDESLAKALDDATKSLSLQCAAWAVRVTPPRWDKASPAPSGSELRKSIVDATHRLTSEVRSHLQRALQAAFKPWMKAAKDAAKAAKLRGRTFTHELGLIEGLEKHIAAWTPVSDGLETFLEGLPLFDVWCTDPGRPAPTTLEDFVRQESAWRPDINDGVRVNIAPLQRKGLLAVDAIATKELGPAIADRATWRADERRWVREGKLPRPGWWPTETP